MRAPAFLCRFVGHRWAAVTWHYAPTTYICARCGEPGFWVET